MGVGGHYRGNFQPVIDDFPVGFIADQINPAADSPAPLFQYFCQLRQSFCGVHPAGGVVGRVYNNRCGFLCYRIGKSLRVKIKALSGIHQFQ